MTIPTEPAIIAVCAAVTAGVAVWLARQVLATSELVRDVHRDITNPRSGLNAIWEALDELRRDFDLHLQAHASPPSDA